MQKAFYALAKLLVLAKFNGNIGKALRKQKQREKQKQKQTRFQYTHFKCSVSISCSLGKILTNCIS